jgi:hypothetical protein
MRDSLYEPSQLLVSFGFSGWNDECFETIAKSAQLEGSPVQVCRRNAKVCLIFSPEDQTVLTVTRPDM